MDAINRRIGSFAAAGEFRGDVEALRGVAVLIVLLFHFELPAFAGGFIGVDVFFVISGFVITRMMLASMEAGRFSLLDFWLGRVRRIFPALAATTALTFVIAAFVLSPQELRKFSSSAISALGSYSNFQFWREAGYFDDAATTKPLLHTWSLAVEAQFYLFRPLVVALLHRSRRITTVAILITLIVLPTAAAQYWLRFDPAAAFFLLPFRIGELVAGAAICWLPQLWNRTAANVLFAAGLALIAAATLTLSAESLFPGINAIPPALGAVFIILAAPASSLSAGIDNTLFRWLGRISYSLYLVHWPVFVLTLGLAGEVPNTIQQLGLIGLSLTLAAALHRWVEQPFRSGSRARPGLLNNRQFASVAVAAVVPLLGALASAHSGWTWRCTDEAALGEALATAKADYEANFNLNYPNARGDPFDITRHASYTCSLDLPNSTDAARQCVLAQLTRPTFIVLGDSHGRDATHALRQAYPDTHFVMLHRSGCLPASYHRSSGRNCFPGLAEIAREFVQTGKVRGIILASRFPESELANFEAYVPILQQITPALLIIGPGPWLSEPPERTLSSVGSVCGQSQLELNRSFSSKIKAASFSAADRVAQYASKLQIPYVPKLEAFCAAKQCRFFDDTSSPLMFDNQHLTRAGIAEFAQWLQGSRPLKQFLGVDLAAH